MKRLLAPAVLAVAFSASLPAQNTGTVGTPASFKDEAKAGLAVELIKKYEGLHDRSDYPYYGYGHCKLPGEELSYDMTEAEAEKLLIRVYILLPLQGTENPLDRAATENGVFAAV